REKYRTDSASLKPRSHKANQKSELYPTLSGQGPGRFSRYFGFLLPRSHTILNSDSVTGCTDSRPPFLRSTISCKARCCRSSESEIGRETLLLNLPRAEYQIGLGGVAFGS